MAELIVQPQKFPPGVRVMIFHVGYEDLRAPWERRFAYRGPLSMGDTAWRVFSTSPNAAAALANGFIVFDIGGNKYRIVFDVVFRSQTTYIKHVFTHKEYDQWQP